jgi:hypothetical protein
MPRKVLVDDTSVDLTAVFDIEGSEDESIAAASIVDPLLEFELDEDGIPQKITEILVLMDKLDEGKNYSKRREGVAKKIRVKLRAFARKNGNENHPAVKHWLLTKDWQPPNVNTLSALMVLIRDMINKAWPLE